MSRFLANENFPVPSISLLRAAGYEVAAIIEDSPGVDDTTVLTRAVHEGRIILTFDRDYGELIFRRRLPAPVGIVYMRFATTSPEEAARRLMVVLSNVLISLEDNFTILDENQVRQRPLP